MKDDNYPQTGVSPSQEDGPPKQDRTLSKWRLLSRSGAVLRREVRVKAAGLGRFKFSSKRRKRAAPASSAREKSKVNFDPRSVYRWRQVTLESETGG